MLNWSLIKGTTIALSRYDKETVIIGAGAVVVGLMLKPKEPKAGI